MRFFIWTLAQNRLPTTDRLRAHGNDHNAMCSLCLQLTETALHLFNTCLFSKDVWNKLCLARPLCYPSLPASIQSISHWWSVCSQHNKEQAVAAAYFAWHMWNERNRRVFNAKSTSADGVVSLINADLDFLRVAL